MKNYFNIGKAALILAVSFSLTQTACRKEEDASIGTANTNQNDGDKVYSPGTFDASVVMPWYALLNKLIIESPGHTPPIAARDIGYTGIALFEATTANNGGHRSMAGQLNGLTTLPPRPCNSLVPPISANAALARIIKQLFANANAANLARIDSTELALDALLSLGYSASDLTNSRNFGHDIANAIFTWSSTDGGFEAYLHVFPASYIVPLGPGLWIPTPPAFSAPMLPYWGSNRTFIAADASPLIDPPAPTPFSTTPGSNMHNAALQVYNTVNNLTQAQKDIATYWADGGGSFTPPGHLISITAQMIRNKNMNLREASIVLAQVGIGLNDAGIVCWRAKYNNNLMRPISYIRQNIDAAWSSFIGTPPFPSYTSGHASFSGTTAAILTRGFGAIAFTDSTKVPYGFTAKSFTNFTTAAQEAATSRLYGGIHYQFDNDNGYNCGVAIALNVKNLHY